MRAKICGITNLEAAELAINSGAWALGFNFHPQSPRYISPKLAANIIENLTRPVVKVGIFVKHTYAQIADIMSETKLDFAQVYQDYSIEPQLKQNMIYCIRPENLNDIPSDNILRQYAYILIDAASTNKIYGGSGKLAAWDLAQQLALNYKLILAGGLQATNVQQAIKTVQPFAVDVASGVETSPGIKDPNLLHNFMREVQYDN